MIKQLLTPFLLFSFIGLFHFHNHAHANSSTPGVTNTEIVFGQSAAFRGASAALGSELWRGAHAYFEHINSRGGVKDRKIRIIAKDDGYEGNKTLVNTISLVNQDKVFGLFGYVGTPTIVAALPAVQRFANTENIFLFSNFTGAQPQREPPHDKYVVNIRSSYRQETAGIVKNLLKVGHKKIGVFIQYDAYGRSGADGVARELKKNGLNIVAEATYVRGTKFSKSMKKQVMILQDAGADAVVSIGSYAACAAFIRDARIAGYDAPIANVSFVGAESLLALLEQEERKREKSGLKKVALTKNLINSQVVPPWSDTSIPLVKEYQRLMDRYQPSVPSHLRDPSYKPSKYSFVSLEGFLNAKVLVEILKKAPKKITRKNFFQTLENQRSINVGLGTNLSYSKKRHQGSDTVFFTTPVKGAYKKLTNWEPFRKVKRHIGRK